MVLAEIGTAGVISAYFFWHMTSGYSSNVSDPIEGQPVQLSYYLCVFGCGLVFWLLVLLWAKFHDSGDRQADIRKVAKLAKLIAPITILNLCGCLLAPFVKLPLRVRFLALFQVSYNLALLLIWAFLSLKESMILLDAHTQQQQKPLRQYFVVNYSNVPKPRGRIANVIKSLLKGSVGGKVDEAGGSGSGHGSGARGIEESRGRYGGNDGGGGAGGGGERGASGSGHGSGASGSGGGSEGGDRGSDGVGDRGASGSGHGSGASGSGGGSEGGDRGSDGGGAYPVCGGRGTNTEQAFNSSKITEMSLMLTAQTTATLIVFLTSSSSDALLVVALMDQLVAFLCGLTSILLSSNKPEDSKAAVIFADIGFFCFALGFILMVAMYGPWYFVLIAVLLFGVVWLIFFRNGLATRATEAWNRVNFCLFFLFFICPILAFFSFMVFWRVQYFVLIFFCLVLFYLCYFVIVFLVHCNRFC